jgi:formate hydrogenlyase subunit 3/multisubunit Na+/H+ antiporter MnhD subunit
MFFRPAAWFFALGFFAAIDCDLIKNISTVLGLICCLFVPVLFFAKRENRKFLGYATCWQNGYIWLLLPHGHGWLFELSVAQGLLLTLLLFGFVENQKHLLEDRMIDVCSMFSIKKSRACVICSAIILLGVLPLLPCFFGAVPAMYVACSTLSCLAYFCFVCRAFIGSRVGI